MSIAAPLAPDASGCLDMDQRPVKTVDDAIITPASYDPSRHRIGGAVYDGPGLVEEALRTSALGWVHGDRRSLAEPLEPSIEVAEAVYLGRFFAHFGHFLLETLPALGHAGPDDALVFHPWPESLPHEWIGAIFRGFLLEAAGVRPSRISLAHEVTRVRHLKVPRREQVILGDIGPVALGIYERVRHSSLKKGRGGFPKRVYLSRRRYPSKRLVVNEAHVEALFEAWGFTVVFPEELPMADQVRLAFEAEVLAGVEGSAMHLCLFMARGSKAVLIQHDHPIQQAIFLTNEAQGIETVSLTACYPESSALPGRTRVDLGSVEKGLAAALGARKTR